MKKFLSIFALSSIFVLGACGNGDTPEEEPEEDPVEEPAEEPENEVDEDSAVGELQDGTYRIEELNFDENGWKEALEITVVGGEITEANWESVDEEGNNKIEDDDYQEAMAGVTEVGPQEFIPALENSLVEVQNPADVEAVSGATSTSTKFTEYAQELVEAAQEGNTETIEVDNSGE